MVMKWVPLGLSDPFFHITIRVTFSSHATGMFGYLQTWYYVLLRMYKGQPNKRIQVYRFRLENKQILKGTLLVIGRLLGLINLIHVTIVE